MEGVRMPGGDGWPVIGFENGREVILAAGDDCYSSSSVDLLDLLTWIKKNRKWLWEDLEKYTGE